MLSLRASHLDPLFGLPAREEPAAGWTVPNAGWTAPNAGWTAPNAGGPRKVQVGSGLKRKLNLKKQSVSSQELEGTKLPGVEV